MSIFRKRPPAAMEFTLEASVRENNRSDVLDTIESLQISRQRLIVVGSGVLALLGLPRQAHDLDIILPNEELEALSSSGQLASGLAVEEPRFSRPERRHFNADTQPLPSELMSHRSVLTEESFEDFMRDQSIPVRQVSGLTDPHAVPEDLRILKPSILYANKMNRLTIGTPEEKARKAAQDTYDRSLISDLNR